MAGRISGCAAFVLILAASALLAGCGPKPPLPSEITATGVIGAIREQTASIRDFSGWARARVSGKGREQSSTVEIRYIAPERFFVTLHGPFGTEMAEIGSDGDSITVYIPYYDGYIRTGKWDNPLALLLPEADIDIGQLMSLLRPSLPPADSLGSYRVSLGIHGNEAELLLINGAVEQRFVVTGPRLLVVEESLTVDGAVVWSARRSDFKAFNGVFFPRRALAKKESGKLDMEFRNITINTDLKESDVTVIIPEGAQQLKIRRR